MGLAKQSRNLGIYRFCVGFLKQLSFSYDGGWVINNTNIAVILLQLQTILKIGIFEKFKNATCTTVCIDVMNMNFDFLTFVVAKLWEE